MNNIKIFFLIIGLLVVGVISTALLRTNNPSAEEGKYDKLAMCLTERGAIFYGAFWCPSCQAQKKLFGNSAKLLPYVECSTVDGQAQTRECIEKNISNYPTWEFSDGSRLVGEIPLATLAEKTGCSLLDTEVNLPAQTDLPIGSGANSPAL